LGQQVAAEAAFSPGWQAIAAAVVFLVVYAVLITEKMSRAAVALAGAVIVALLGAVGLEEAYSRHIPWRMLFLLAGMMLLTGLAVRTGLVQYAALKAVQRVKGCPVRMLAVLTVAAAAVSALLDGVTAVLLLVPLTFSITRVLKVSPAPYLIAEIVAVNVGGAATMVGSLPNMMIGGSNPRLTYGDFLAHTGLISLLILMLTVSALVWLYRGRLSAGKAERKELLAIDAAGAIQDRPLAIRTLIVFALTLLGFVLHGPLSEWTGVRVEASTVALAGATLLMLAGLKGKSVDEAIDGIEWRTVVFFAGLFAVVGGLAETGVIARLAMMALQLAHGDIGYLSVLVLWLSGIVSATVDNTPYVAAMIPLVQEFGVQMELNDPGALDPVWWSLALGASLGGSGTLIGAAANVVVAGMAAREGREISYLEYLKIGAPITLLSLVVSTGYVILFLL
jgi:Na+/H+ antiporter NhaD/arsenite permease-like protein